MGIYYAISDIHGCYEAFDEALERVDLSGDNKLVLLGDYIHGGEDSYRVLDKIMELEDKYGTDKVIVLAGNHEDMVCSGMWSISSDRFNYYGDNENDFDEDKYINWLQNLHRYYVADDKVLFVHAGVDEEAEEYWEYGTDENMLTEKYPATTGKFCLTLVAGHVGTCTISGDPYFHDIYFDGQSHYYIDSTVLDSGYLNVIKVDTDKDRFYRVTETDEYIIFPYELET